MIDLSDRIAAHLATSPELTSDLLGELARDCEREAARPCRTREGRDLAQAYGLVADVLTMLQELIPLTDEVRT